MSSRSSPKRQRALLSVPIEYLTRWVLRSPHMVLAIAAIVSVLSVYLTMTRLGYRTSRQDLLNPNSEYSRLWVEYIREFGDDDDAVVVVEGPNREMLVPVLEELTDVLDKHDRLFHSVLHEVDLDKIRAKGLHYLEPEQLAEVEGFLRELQPVLQGDWARLNLGNMTADHCVRMRAVADHPNDPHAAAVLADTHRFSQSILAAISETQTYYSPWNSMPQSLSVLSNLRTNYLLMNEGRLGIVLLRLADDSHDSFVPGTEAVDALRDLTAQMSARHPDVKIGLTGLPIMENDEMRAGQTSMTWASVLSLIGVSCLFVAGFGGIRHAMLASLVLLIAMVWSFGYVTLSVGHLNIISVAFTVTLIGIGIDYGIHYIARYMQLRGESYSCDDAILRSASAVGPAIATGAITTSIAFFASGLTKFTGVAEMGIIAGGGILLCAVATLTVLPAMVAIVDRRRIGWNRSEPVAVHRWVAPFARFPKIVLGGGLAFTLIISLGITQLWYDHNLLNLQAEGLESVELEHKLLEDCNQSVWFALSIADSREELLQRKQQFLRLETVDRCEEIVSLLPTDDNVKSPTIARIRQQLETLPERPPLLGVDRPENLGLVLSEAQALCSRLPQAAETARNFEQVRDHLRRLPLSACYSALSHYQQQLAGDLLSRLHVLRAMANPEPPQLEDLPASLVDRFVGEHGKHLLKIYGRGDIWDMDALSGFVADVRSIDPRATGNPLQAYEASQEMVGSYRQAAFYAAIVILTVLFLDFRSIPMALLAAAPIALGTAQMFGLMGLLSIPLNPANLIALPLILGIGVDYGVHLVHEFREQSGRYRLSPSTALALMVDALTTIVGFGALMIASHQGLQSLGRILTIGVTCCLFTTLLMLPALLSLLTRNRKDAAEEASLGDETPGNPRRADTDGDRTPRRNDPSHEDPRRADVDRRTVPHAKIRHRHRRPVD